MFHVFRAPLTGLVWGAHIEPHHVAMLHPLLKPVASRLPGPEIGSLNDALVTTVAEIGARLAGRFRQDTEQVEHLLALYRQNLLESLRLSLDLRRFEQTADILDGVLLYCRYNGDVNDAGRYLDQALPYFIDTRTGELRPEHREIGRRVWDHAVWISRYWPRDQQGMGGQVGLLPPDGDHYAHGLFFRSVGRYRQAYNAFQAEVSDPAPKPRYQPGDLEWFLAEMNALLEPPGTAAIEASRLSFERRLPGDSIGRASSLIQEAWAHAALAYAGRDRLVDAQNPKPPPVLSPEELGHLERAAQLLDRANAEAGGMSAENESESARLWSLILLDRGELTAAMASYRLAYAVLSQLQDTSLIGFLCQFGLGLLRHGWAVRAYEVLSAAFNHAVQAGDHATATRLRLFTTHLRTKYPEIDR